MIVELKGAQFVNQGAHLMLHAVMARVRAHFPQARFALAPGPYAPASTRRTHGLLMRLPLRKRALDLNSLSDLWPAPVDRWLLRHGVVAEGGLDAVLDLSGYAYGDRWGERPLRATARQLVRSAAHGRPYVFLPQAFGPFTHTRAAAMAFGDALPKAAFVAARDAASFAALASVAPSSTPLHLLPDLTIGCQGEPAAAAAWGVDERTALLIPNLRMIDAAGAWQEGYLALFERLAAELRAAGFTPRVLNHSGQEDRALALCLAARIGASSSPDAPTGTVIEEPDPLRTKGVIGAAGFVVSSRYHGCVSALAQGVPCLATSWSHKYQALFADFGLAEAVITEPDVERACVQMQRLLDSRATVVGQLRIAADRLAARVETMWSDVLPRLGAARCA